MVSTPTPAGPSVVVPATTNPSTVACLRSLGSAGVHTVVLSGANTTTALASTYCDEVVTAPDPETNLRAYKDVLLDLAARRDVRSIVPIHECDIYLLSRYHDEFDRHVSVPVPPIETLERVHDRVALAEAAEAAGVPVPETQPMGDVEDWSGEQLVKSRYNLVTSQYHDGTDPETAAAPDGIDHVPPGESPAVEAIRAEMSHDPIVQEYVPADEEYMIGALYNHGDPLIVFQHQQIRGTSYIGSGGAYRESVSIPELEAVATDLLDELEWHGLACIEYLKHRETGEFVLAEINPRMWQSLSSTVAMGADFPAAYWKLATGRADTIDPEYDVGVGCHWLKGELLYVLSLFRYDSPFVERPSYLGTAAEILTSCLEQPKFDYLSLDDPKPFVQEWADAVGQLPAAAEFRDAVPSTLGAVRRKL